MRVFHLLNWTELDIWTYIQREGIPIVPLYVAQDHDAVERGGRLIDHDEASFMEKKKREGYLAVNKIDLMGFGQAVFDAITAEFATFSASLGFSTVTPIPISARYGDNVVSHSDRMPWYTGHSLLSHLEQIEVADTVATQPFRMPVQWASRPSLDFRGYCGTIATGQLRVGDTIDPAGDAVTVTLADEIDISRGNALADPAAEMATADQFQAHLIWLDAHPLIAGRTYLFKLGTATVNGSITRIRHRIDVNTGEKLSATDLSVNDVAVVHISLQSAVPFTPFAESGTLGGFIVVDRQSNRTAAVGMIDFALTRSSNIAWQELSVERESRAAMKGQRPMVVWFTGLSVVACTYPRLGARLCENMAHAW